MPKILIIDDDLVFSNALSLYLNKAGYDVATALTGYEGLAKVAADRPGLIILDLMLPDMDGYEVCHQLRADHDTARIPILMFTARVQVNDKLHGFEAGADDYITKPAHLAEVLARVKALLRRASRRRSP